MKLLDLFCGAGGAAMGYYWGGFEEIVGIDIEKQKNYPFDFIQANALQPPVDFDDFDLIHASPPCQFYSWVTPLARKDNHSDLIGQVREILSGRSYVIENVVGARSRLRNPFMLCGSMFGLKCFRHRLFEINPALLILTPPCKHDFRPLLVTTAGNNSRRIRKPGGYKTVKNAILAYGIDWMKGSELAEAIPPAYTEFISKHFISFLNGGRDDFTRD